MSKQNKIIVIVVVVLALVIGVAGTLIGVKVYNKHQEAKNPEPEIVEEATLPSGATTPTETGGNASITLSDGTVVYFNIPSDFYALREDYLDLVTYAYGLTDTVVSDNLIVAGNSNSVYTSTDAITATSFSDLYGIYGQIYGDDWNDVAIEDVYPPIYQYILTGEIPSTPYTNYEISELDSITKDGITYRVFTQDYDAESTYTDEETGEEQTATQHVHQLTAYSDTDDAIEILVDVDSGETADALALLQTFIG